MVSALLLIPLQSFLALGVGTIVHRQRLTAVSGMFLSLLWTGVQMGVMAADKTIPTGDRMTEAHLVRFLLSGSSFLVLTRIAQWTLLDVTDTHGQQNRTMPLSRFLAVFFVAPVSATNDAIISRRFHHLTLGAAKLGALVLALRACLIDAAASALHGNLLLFSAAGNVFFYLLLSGMEDMISQPLEIMFGQLMRSTFDSPWLATTHREFWARRWHTPFRDAFSDMARSMQKAGVPPLVSAATVFAFSGAGHLLQLYVGLRLVDFHLFGFFLVAFALCIVDPLLESRCPSWLARGFVLGSLTVASELFWMSLWEHDFLGALARSFW